MTNVELNDPTQQLLSALKNRDLAALKDSLAPAANKRSAMARVDACAGWNQYACFDMPQFGVLTDFFVTVFIKLERQEREGHGSGANHFSFRVHACDPHDGSGMEGLAAALRAMFIDAIAAPTRSDYLSLRKRPRQHPSILRALSEDDGDECPASPAVPALPVEGWDGEWAGGGEGGGVGCIPAHSMEAQKYAVMAALQGNPDLTDSSRHRVCTCK